MRWGRRMPLWPPRFSGPGGRGNPRWMVFAGLDCDSPSYCEWIVPVDLDGLLA